MARRHKPRTGTYAVRAPRRGEVWLAVDRDKNHNGKEKDRVFEDNVQGGTRTCIIVSNNRGNTHSPNVEVVFTTKQDKAKLPTHFITNTTPVPSTVLCEAPAPVPKRDLIQYYGKIPKSEEEELNRCLKIALELE